MADLESIARVARRIPGVRDAMAQTRGKAPARVVVYVVGNNGARLTPGSVRAALEADPSIAAPDLVLLVEHLPRAEKQPFGTTVESQVSSIWSELLDVNHPDPDTNFFAVGGHSLLAARVVARVLAEIDVDLPVRAVFEAPSLGEFARAVSAAAVVGRPRLPLVKRVITRPAQIPLSFQQEWLWRLYKQEPSLAEYNLGTAFQLDGDLDLAALTGALGAIVERHEALRTTFAVVDGMDCQIITGRPLKVDIRDLTSMKPSDVDAETTRLGLDQWGRPFDLHRDLVLRAMLVKQAPSRHVLIITRHFIANDGSSLGLILSELATLYKELHLGVPSTLPAVKLQYPDYALWQREHFAGAVMNRQVQHWIDMFKGGVPILHLPDARTNLGATNAEWIEKELPGEVSESIRAVCRSEGVTLFMFMLASFATLLYGMTGDEEMVVGSDVANRGRPGTDAIVGMFLNTLAFRVDTSGNPSFAELLRRVRKLVLDGYDNQEAPFNEVFRALTSVTGGKVRSPFRVMLVVQNFPRIPLVLEELRVTQILLGKTAMGSASIDFDIELVAADSDGVIQITLACCPRLFGAEGAQQLCEAIGAVAAGAAANPLRSVPALAASVIERA